jgi:hypothetical protein
MWFVGNSGSTTPLELDARTVQSQARYRKIERKIDTPSVKKEDAPVTETTGQAEGLKGESGPVAAGFYQNFWTDRVGSELNRSPS